RRRLGARALVRHRLRFQVLGAREERGIRVRDSLLLAPVRRDESEVRRRHEGEEEDHDRERDHAHAVVAKAPPREGPEAGRIADLGGRRIGEDGAHLKETRGSTSLYITSTRRLMI